MKRLVVGLLLALSVLLPFASAAVDAPVAFADEWCEDDPCN